MRIIFPDRDDSPRLGYWLRRLPALVLMTSCSAPLISYIIKKLFALPSLIEFFSLSTAGVQSHQFWQFFTYPLITSDSLTINQWESLEITQRLLIRNTIDFVFFRQATDHLVRKLGARNFLILLVVQVLVTGLVVCGLLWSLRSSQSLLGPESLLCSLLLVWVFLDPERRLSIPVVPLTIARKWGFLFLMAFYFLILAATGAFALFLGSVVSVIISILFCKKEHIPNPYRKAG